ncbi:phosphatidylserine/phosphatidylglycerophosphate/cardiolipin synthase family protein [Prevotella sp. E2-28]|uniref:phospholipase D-like domain-containing protein n=1 Tax=Prevotella sp. E2-28 TaxID=2913620 RepID=UPI001EDBE11E|nr:phospholipase D-like domain-containing protein [Prevotella sp. E2-28]UKK52591.1 phospholipase D-like domain-containing protein [Prevotella sp. E2-28]
MKKIRHIMVSATLIALAFFTPNQLKAQENLTSDTLIYQQLMAYDVNFSNNNSVSLLMSGQEKFDDMFEAIRQAKHSVHLEYFNFRNDSIAMLLFEVLKAKRKEGVEIRAMFDAFGNDSNNQPLRKHHLEALRKEGIDIVEFDPIRFPWVNHIWPRDHRKIVVIDGCVAYTGGMNVADYYIKGTEQVGAWRDMHCRIEGGAVNDLQQIFCRIWKKATGEDLADSAQYFRGNEQAMMEGLKPDTTATAGHKLVGIINREPRTTNDVMRYFYVNAINDAQDSIHIINPYFTLIPCINKAIKNAIKRGIKVDIMLSAKSDIPLTPDCAFYNAHKLMKRGANIWLYQPGFHHSKIMMVDGRFCTVGSTNLDARSTRFDYEENAVIIDRCTTRELDDMFERDKKESVYLTPQTWKEFRTPWQRFRGWFAHLLRPFL